MPWCPKCKNEYRDGFTFCSDCNTPLVASLDISSDRPLCHFNDDEAYSKFIKYLEYSRIQAKPVYVDDIDYLSFSEDDYDQAKKALAAFVKVEGNLACVRQIDGSYIVDTVNMQEVASNLKKLHEAEDKHPDSPEASENDNRESSEEEIDTLRDFVYAGGSTVYESKKAKAEEMSGSGYMLIFIGIGGIVFVLLHMLGLLSIVNTQLFSYIMMLFMFVAMTYWGFHSLKKSKEYQADSVQEEQLTNHIKTWLSQNISADDIKSADSSENSPEENFLLRIDYIKKRMTLEIPELVSLDEVYLDSLVEEYYNGLFDD